MFAVAVATMVAITADFILSWLLKVGFVFFVLRFVWKFGILKSYTMCTFVYVVTALLLLLHARMHTIIIYTRIDRYREVGRRRVNTYQRVVVVVVW